jgi:hypothetical protein
MRNAILGLLLLLAATLSAQSNIPAGTLLPVRLDTGLNTQKIKPGQTVHASIMQHIPGTEISRGSHVLGHVVDVAPTHITLRFDTVSVKGHNITVTTDLRALASLSEVESAQLPESGADRGTPKPDWTTTQVGGDQVYRGGGPVARGVDTVGKPTDNGVVGGVTADLPCRGPIDNNNSPQAFWIFSTNACGLYGYDNLSLDHAGRSNPVGTIQISAKSGKLSIGSGSGLLLRVQGS